MLDRIPGSYDYERDGADIQLFLSDGMWTKPKGFNANSLVLLQMLCGGASGASRSTTGVAAGGSGGTYWDLWPWFNLALFGDTETVVVGSDAAGVSGNSNGNPGSAVSITFNSGAGKLIIPGAQGPGQNSIGATGNVSSSQGDPSIDLGNGVGNQTFTYNSNITVPYFGVAAVNVAVTMGLYRAPAGTIGTVAGVPIATANTYLGGGSGGGWSSGGAGVRTGGTGIIHSSVGGTAPGAGGGAGGNGTGLGAGGSGTGQGGTSGIGRKGFVRVIVLPIGR